MKAIILTLVSVFAICFLLVCGIVFTSRERLKVESSEIDINTIQVKNSLDCTNEITRTFDKHSIQILDRKEINNSQSIEFSFENPSDDIKLEKFYKEYSLILDNGCKVD